MNGYMIIENMTRDSAVPENDMVKACVKGELKSPHWLNVGHERER